jgi:diaminopimelate decarboxylase
LIVYQGRGHHGERAVKRLANLIAPPDDLVEQINHLEVLGARTVAAVLRDHLLDLLIEPGRSLLAHAGLTAATVLDRRRSPGGRLLVGLEMKRSDVSFLDQEFFVDPSLVATAGQRRAAEEGLYLMGNLCLESDLVTRRQVFLERLPEPGDLLVFHNTAGYLSDFSAGDPIKQRVARRVVVARDDDGSRWALDDVYHPLTGSSGEPSIQ